MTPKYILDGPEVCAPLENWVTWRDSLLALDQDDEIVAFEVSNANEVIALKIELEAQGLKAAA